MKVVTLHEPWATFIAHGIKNIETRSWETKYRGRIAIHSGKRIIQIPSYVRTVMRDHGIQCGDLQYGKILATATLRACARMSLPVIESQTMLEITVGDWGVGRYAWFLEDIKKLDEPIPARGFRRIWNIDDNLIPAKYR